MKRALRHCLFVCLVAALVIGSYWLGSKAPRAGPETVHLADSLPLTDGDSTHEQESLLLAGRSTPLLIFAFSVTCPYCDQVIPHWTTLLREITDQSGGASNFQVLTVGPPLDAAAVLATTELKRLKVARVETSALSSLGVAVYPCTILVPAGSSEAFVWNGVLGDSDVREILDRWEH